MMNMKKIFFLLAIASFVACTNDEEMNLLTENLPEESVSIEKRSFQEALEVAQQTIDMFATAETRANDSQRKIALSNTRYITNKTTTRNGKPDTLMYIFNFEDNQGFSIISANKATEPLLAQTEQGSYNENTENENPAFGMYMDLAEQYVSARGGILNPSDTLIIFREHKIEHDTTVIYVSPKISTRWGQTGCEATYTPNGYSGCSNTAMAQIMTYFGHPTQLSINYPNAPISSLSLNWNAIKEHNIQHLLQSCNASENVHNSIGYLHRQLGHLNGSTYHQGATSTLITAVRNTFSTLGYNVSNINYYNAESIYSSLGNNNLIYMRGECMNIGADNDTTFVGHAWIVDGYYKYRIVTSEWSRNANLFGAEWELLREYESYTPEYYHMNWGWDGFCNGYFAAEVFATNEAVEYDNSYNFIENDFKYNVLYFTTKK